MAGALSPRFRALLLARTHRANFAAGKGVGHQAGAAGQPRHAVLFPLPAGEGTPAARRLLPPQDPPGTPPRFAARKPCRVLPAACLRGDRHASPAGGVLLVAAPHSQKGRTRPAPLYRSSADPGPGGATANEAQSGRRGVNKRRPCDLRLLLNEWLDITPPRRDRPDR